MVTSDLPDIYALALGPNGPHARAYISGKLLVPMLQLIYSTWVTHLQVLDHFVSLFILAFANFDRGK